MSKKMEQKVMSMVGKKLKTDVKHMEAGWPPICIGLLHQPKCPERKADTSKRK